MEKIESIMLVDDCVIDNFINQRVIEHYGNFAISTFITSSSALSYLEKIDSTPKYIFIDIYMPGIGGFDFLEKIKKLDCKKIILSSSINPEDLERAKKQNAHFMEKPLTLEKFRLYCASVTN